MALGSIKEFYDNIYSVEEMDFFLKDSNMSINSLIYEHMTRKLKQNITWSFEEYFRYAYSICAKLNTDEYPDAHFKVEYWEELPAGDLHRLVTLAIVYLLIAFQRTPRTQYFKMMRAIFDWEVLPRQSYNSHTLLQVFFPVMEQCLKQKKRNCFVQVPGEDIFKQTAPYLLFNAEYNLGATFKEGSPKRKKDAQEVMKETQETLLMHMRDLEKERENHDEQNPPVPQSGSTDPNTEISAPKFKIAAKGKFAQVLHILCKMGIITDLNGKPASTQDVAERIGPAFGEKFNRISSSVTEAYEQDNWLEIFNDMHTHAENYQNERQKRKNNK